MSVAIGRMGFWRCVVGALALCAAWANAAQSAKWVLSSDGARVTDPMSKLIWMRCPAGQDSNGATCVGTVTLFTHGEAVAWAAKQRTPEDGSCRLPTLGELKGLVKNSVAAGSGRFVLLSAQEPQWRWVRTSRVETRELNQYDYGNIAKGRNNDNLLRVDVTHAWAVNVVTGDLRSDVPKRNRLPVQLVCQAS